MPHWLPASKPSNSRCATTAAFSGTHYDTTTQFKAQSFPATVRGDAQREHDRRGHDAVVDAYFAVGRVEEHIRVAQRGRVPVTERADFGIEAAADARDFGFGDAGIGAERYDEIVDVAGGDDHANTPPSQRQTGLGPPGGAAPAATGRLISAAIWGMRIPCAPPNSSLPAEQRGHLVERLPQNRKLLSDTRE